MAKNKADAEPVLYANTSNAAGAEPFLPGTLLSTDAASNTARVQPATGGAPLKLPRSSVFLKSPACPGGHPDNAQLYHLDEANLLDNLKVRFAGDAIYTYTGTVLLALNPYKSVGGLYDEGVMDGYRGRALGVQPPHVYAIAERARRAIATGATDQSIVVSGESGAGKTESCRAIVQYLAHHSKHASGDLASALLAANPLIEAFGCAATTRNKNSSRFGKLMQIWTSAEASSDTLNASSVVTYLLEKGRVSHHAAGEQTFHAFYYLHAAAADSGITLPWLNERVTQESAMRLLHPAGTTLADATTSTTEQQTARKAAFDEVAAALKSLGVSDEEAHEAWSLLGAILALGELEFEDEDSTDKTASAAATDEGKATLPERHNAALDAAASILGVESAILKARLTSKTVVSGRGSNYVIRYSIGAATKCRDGLAHELYDRLFKWLVRGVNKSLGGGADGSTPSAADGSKSISILDIFGFERLPTNSLEQLLINHTNERLQLFFLHQTLHAEMELYATEGVPAPSIALTDNMPCVNLVMGRNPDGLTTLLEDECHLPKPSDDNLVSRLYSAHGSHACLLQPTRPSPKGMPQHFVIKHFAGAVDYDSNDFVFKNSDALHPDLPLMLSAATSPLVATLFDDANPLQDTVNNQATPGKPQKSARGRGRRGSMAAGGGAKTRGIAGTFSKQLDSLMSLLEQTTPHYVRCIKPTEAQKPGIFEGGFILHQLRCGGAPQLLELMGKGFPTRTEYENVCERYRPRLPALSGSTLSAKSFVQALLSALDLKEARTGDTVASDEAAGATPTFALGVRRVFFNMGGMAALDKLMHGTEEEMESLVAKVNAFVHRKRWRQAISLVKACNKLQRRVNARRSLSALALRARALTLVCKMGRKWANNARMSVKRAHAASTMAAFARGLAARRTLSHSKMAAIKIQTRARSSLAVKALAAAKAEFEATKSAKAVGSLLLQRVARGMLARKVATTLREAARVKAEEEAAAAAKAAEEAAAAEAARIAAEEEAARIKAEEEAAKAKRAAAQRQRAMSHSAVVCQALVRGKMGRRVAEETREAAKAAAAEKEALKEKLRKQRSAKGEAKAQNASALSIQTAARCLLARKKLSELKSAKVKAKEAAKAKAAEKRMAVAERLKRSAASTTLQGGWRCLLARRALTAAREAKAAKLANRKKTVVALAAAFTSSTAKQHADGAVVLSGDAARYVAAVRLQGRWRMKRINDAERRDLQEKLWLAEQREVVEQQARDAEEAKYEMYKEMESTLTTLTTEHAVQLAKVRKEADEKAAQLLKVKEEEARITAESAAAVAAAEEEARLAVEAAAASPLRPLAPPQVHLPPPPPPVDNLIDLASPVAGGAAQLNPSWNPSAGVKGIFDDLEDDMPGGHVPKSIPSPENPNAAAGQHVLQLPGGATAANNPPALLGRGNHRSPKSPTKSEAGAPPAASPRRRTSLLGGGAVRQPLSPRRSTAGGNFNNNNNNGDPPTPGKKEMPATPLSQAKRLLSRVVSAATPSRSRSSIMPPPPPPPPEDGLGQMMPVKKASKRQSMLPSRRPRGIRSCQSRRRASRCFPSHRRANRCSRSPAATLSFFRRPRPRPPTRRVLRSAGDADRDDAVRGAWAAAAAGARQPNAEAVAPPAVGVGLVAPE